MIGCAGMSVAVPWSMNANKLPGDFGTRGAVVVIDRSEYSFPPGAAKSDIARARRNAKRDGLVIVSDGIATSGTFAGWHVIVAELHG